MEAEVMGRKASDGPRSPKFSGFYGATATQVEGEKLLTRGGEIETARLDHSHRRKASRKESASRKYTREGEEPTRR